MDDNVFRNVMGARRYGSLFIEYAGGNNRCLYTIKKTDHKDGYRSIHRLYVEMGDPSEKIFADTYFENYEHWCILCSKKWFQPLLADMRRELEVSLKGEAIKNIREVANDEGHKSHFAANKFLLEKGWLGEQISETDIAQSLNKADDSEVSEAMAIKEDLNRLVDGELNSDDEESV